MNHLVPDLFGLDPINDRIQHWWSQNADIAQKDVDMVCNVVPEPLGNRGKDPRPIEEDDGAHMGTTSIESLVASILGRYAEDGTEDQHIGNEN